MDEQSRSSETQRNWRFLDHTADLRIEILGRTLTDLFINAANALCHVLVGSAQVVGTRERRVTLRADNVEDLMVDWLRELLFEYQAHGKIPAGVKMLKLEPGSLDSLVAFGVPKEPVESDFEIKAVTYHGLKIHQKGDRYSAKVIFDV